MDPEALEPFGYWLVNRSWDDVFEARGSNAKAAAYEQAIAAGVEGYFPLKTTRRKDTDPPWINDKVRRKIRRRKAVYRIEGRSAKWKSMKKQTDQLIKRRIHTRTVRG